MALEIAEVEIVGLAPLLMHKYVMGESISDPKKKPIKDAEYWEKISQEWRQTAYWDDKIGLYIPSDAVEACMKNGGKSVKIGRGTATKSVEAGVNIHSEFLKIPVITPDGEEVKSLDDIEDLEWILVKPVRVPPRTGARIERKRVQIPVGWKAKFKVIVNTDVITRNTFETVLRNAGMTAGLLNWRPKYGRFDVENIKWTRWDI